MTNQEAYENLCKRASACDEIKSEIEKLIKDFEKSIELAETENKVLNVNRGDVDFLVYLSISNIGAIIAWELVIEVLKNLLQRGGEK